jgi:enhancing lycopene biosynthesis protein 2
MHVIDTTKGEPMDETRNVMIESSRITRGDIKDLTELKASNYDALFVPGGFGVAKNLSDFAVKG